MADKNTTGAPRPVPPEVADVQDEVVAEGGSEFTVDDFLRVIDRTRPRS